jgi:uncharacterized protein (DUF433 family)
MQNVLRNHIEITPGVCGGRPRIAGHRIRVQDIVAWHEDNGQSPQQIVEEFPQITLADVHASLTYYYDHKDAIRGQMADDDAFFEQYVRDHPEDGILIDWDGDEDESD